MNTTEQLVEEAFRMKTERDHWKARAVAAEVLIANGVFTDPVIEQQAKELLAALAAKEDSQP